MITADEARRIMKGDREEELVKNADEFLSLINSISNRIKSKALEGGKQIEFTIHSPFIARALEDYYIQKGFDLIVEITNYFYKGEEKETFDFYVTW